MCLMVTPFSLFSLCWVHVTLVQRDYLLANSTGKAAWMVSLSQSCHYFTFHEVSTAIAAGPIHALVIQGAEIFPILNEKASLCQVTATHWKRKNPHSNRLEKIHLTKDVSNSLLPTDEMTLVVLLTSTTFSGYKRACNKDFSWRNLHNNNFQVLGPHQDLSYLQSSS